MWLHHFLDALLHFWDFGLWCVGMAMSVVVFACVQGKILLGSIDLAARQRCNRWRTGLNVVAGSYGALAIPSSDIKTHCKRQKKTKNFNISTDVVGLLLHITRCVLNRVQFQCGYEFASCNQLRRARCRGIFLVWVIPGISSNCLCASCLPKSWLPTHYEL